MTPIGGPPLSVSGGEKPVPIRYDWILGRGLDSVLGQIDAPGLLSYFFVLFSFLIFGLFHIFCKIDSNQFKPLPKIF
jgi:hypothetical protein